MGQYWKPVNLDKREFINPHKLGAGLKLWEQLAAHPGTGAALLVLLAAMPEPRGGGDLAKDDDIAKRTIGRWVGDRVVLVGDYAEDNDFAASFAGPASEIYGKCGEGEPGAFRDITDDVCAVLARELGGEFKGDGWREFVEEGR